MEALEALERVPGGDSGEVAQPDDFSGRESINPGSEHVPNLNKDTSRAADLQLDCSAGQKLDISADHSTLEKSSALGSSRPAKRMKWRERARYKRPRSPVSAAENPVGNGFAVTSTCTRRPLEFIRSSETGGVHQELFSISSPNVPHSVQEPEVGQSLQALAADPEMSPYPLQEELVPSAQEAEHRLSSQVGLAQASSFPVEAMDVELSRGPFCPNPSNHIQASDFDVVDNQPWSDLAERSSSVPMDRPPSPRPQQRQTQKQKQKQQRGFPSVTHSRGHKRIRPDDLTSSLPADAGPPQKTTSKKRQKASSRRPKHHATTAQINHVEPADDNAELPLDVHLRPSGPSAEASELSYQDLTLCDPDSLLSPGLVRPAAPTHKRQKAPIRRPHVPAQASPVVDPDSRYLGTLPFSVPRQGVPQPNGSAESGASGPSNQVSFDSPSPPSPVEPVLSETAQVPDGFPQRPSGEEVTTQLERRAEYKPNMRRLRSQVNRKLKAWGRKSHLSQGGDETGAQHGNREERFLMSEEQRDAFVSQMVKSCRRDHWLRATFLDAVKELADVGVLQTAPQLVAQGPSDTSEAEVNTWTDMSVCSPPDCSSSPKSLLDLYKAADLLHEKGESAMQNLVPSEEDDPSSCSLHQTPDGAWALKMPVSRKR